MATSLVGFAAAVDIAGCGLQNRPDYVFLCGGPVEPARRGRIRSARDYFYRNVPYALREKLLLAERVNRWFENQELFKDLLLLEEYIADLSALILLFVEGPGSLAELGAFAGRKTLAGKTAVVSNQAHPQEGTFIADGPVRLISNLDDELVHCYQWNDRLPGAKSNLPEFQTMAEDIGEFLLRRIDELPTRVGFIRANRGHQLMLLADLVEVAGATTTAELSEALGLIGEPLDRMELERQLFLLTQLKLIERVRVSNQRFIVARKKLEFVHYTFKREADIKDMIRLRAGIRVALKGAQARAWKQSEKAYGAKS